MSPSSEETPGHTEQDLRVSLEFLSLTVLRLSLHTGGRPTTQLVHVHPIFIAGTPSDARFEVVGKFFNVQNINHARVAERTAVVLLCERYEGWPTNRAKITQRQGGEKYKKRESKTIVAKQ